MTILRKEKLKKSSDLSFDILIRKEETMKIINLNWRVVCAQQFFPTSMWIRKNAKCRQMKISVMHKQQRPNSTILSVLRVFFPQTSDTTL